MSKNYWKTEDKGAKWQKWINDSDRPAHRLPLFSWTPRWLPGLPILNKKVDSIYWCRNELSRLNMEIEEDQKCHEKYPLMTSAFIQFNNQSAAHMACQSVTHHTPKCMAPRMVEVSPNDIIWSNMAIKWWGRWARKSVVLVAVCGMVILWGIPVAGTASLSNVDALIRRFSWLRPLKSDPTLYNVVKAAAGVLPALVLGTLLTLVPDVLDIFAEFQGCKTGSEKSEVVQVYYFVFLFVQVFFVVSITSGTLQTITDIGSDVASSIPTLLAKNLPKAANYFFSYMILQALSTSSGVLLQVDTLLVRYFLARITDTTARNKWTRNTRLPTIKWGFIFPVYTNFACIALIYSIVAPLISIFAITTFGLLWVANRYNVLYVAQFRTDTGGVLYPRAINQTFTGLYTMELCLTGLFFLDRDDRGANVGFVKAIIMIVAFVLTVLYQYLLNLSFGPLLRYLPTTSEDEAVLRDNEFQSMCKGRLGDNDNIEMRKEYDSDSAPTFGTDRGYRGDLEAQNVMGDGFHGDPSQEIEDLTPEKREFLVGNAFQHFGLRARRPIVWIPRDDNGVCDDEIRRTKSFSEHVWVSNEGATLDSAARVLYSNNPPDFSKEALINL